MLDFFKINTKRNTKTGVIEIYPTFVIGKSKDLMIRGGDFYAVWVEDRQLWSTDEEDVINIIDNELFKAAEEKKAKNDSSMVVMTMRDADTGIIDKWHKYCQKQCRDSFHTLDETLLFSNSKIKKTDYATKRLNYALEPGECPSWDKLITTLYSPEEQDKLEWAIGSIVTGDSKKIQKFIVMYGEHGTGKSTILNIIQDLFEGYWAPFDARALGSSTNQFALEAFASNPLIAIQHDGDLSHIEDNTKLNSLVSHETMSINAKYAKLYAQKFQCFLFMGTNRPVKITDGKSGLLRRLIDVTPSGKKFPKKEYDQLIRQVKFELGAIACKCRDSYLEDPGRYDTYSPINMLEVSNDFYNYMCEYYSTFLKEDGVTQKQAWEMYKTYVEDAKVSYPFSLIKFKEELRNYFWEYDDRYYLEDGTRARSYYHGFRTDKFESETTKKDDSRNKAHNTRNQWLFLSELSKGIFEISDLLLALPAQLAADAGTPSKKWSNVRTKLSDINQHELHYVKIPENHIVIDFDLKDESGNKSFERNFEAASKWPPTYAELSKSGAGIHLHYIYTGDTSRLSRLYDEDIEVKVFTGNSSLRRKLTKCNNLDISTISSGLPLKEEKPVINQDIVQSEKGLRKTITKCLNKEVHSSTKCNIDFIYKILQDAYDSGMPYDVSDMTNDIVIFATKSTNQAAYCIDLVNKMKFRSEEPSPGLDNVEPSKLDDDTDIFFYDVEVFPNLFLVNYKPIGEGKPVTRLINPTPQDIEHLIRLKLVGFNCRRYDNHMLYARLMGYTNNELYYLSQKIIAGEKDAFFGEAYNLSYTDIYDYAALKQSLKKWEIDLGIHHQELGLDWNKPVPEELWLKVAEYCDNDVIATEAVWNATQGDWTARKILAELAGMTRNDTTNSLTTRIIFGREKKPTLVYTDLATGESTDGTKKEFNAFPGYEFKWSNEDKKYHNMYRGTDVGMGGYVFARPGMYGNVALLDVASLHPNSAINMNAFGEYTKNYKDILDARLHIKHKEFDEARKMLNGRLAPYLDDESTAKQLALALKIAINSVYGLTSASFANPFKDPRNVNNIVALRGALFMRMLQDEVESRGFTVAHIKTDSIKIPDATPDIIQFVQDFGRKYGYNFEHEATYDRMCLVNDAVYIAKYSDDKKINGDHAGEWTATGTQFQVPYVFKTLFSKEPIEFRDLCETKSVQTSLYLDMNEDSDEHSYQFIGKIGLFCPIKPGCGGGLLVREGKDKNGQPKYDSATGTKGYRWLEAERVKIEHRENDIDLSYYNALVDDAVTNISKYGDFEWFVSDDPYVPTWTPLYEYEEQLPWE